MVGVLGSATSFLAAVIFSNVARNCSEETVAFLISGVLGAVMVADC